MPRHDLVSLVIRYAGGARSLGTDESWHRTQDVESSVAPQLASRAIG